MAKATALLRLPRATMGLVVSFNCMYREMACENLYYNHVLHGRDPASPFLIRFAGWLKFSSANVS
jgi:hypothetical protein